MLDIDQRDEGGVAVVKLGGRLDVLTCKDLGLKLEEDAEVGMTRIVLDLSGLDYVSSAGLRVLLQARKTLKPMGGTLALAAANEFVKDVMQTTGFNTIFPFHDTVDEAVAALKA